MPKSSGSPHKCATTMCYMLGTRASFANHNRRKYWRREAEKSERDGFSTSHSKFFHLHFQILTSCVCRFPWFQTDPTRVIWDTGETASNYSTTLIVCLISKAMACMIIVVIFMVKMMEWMQMSANNDDRSMRECVFRQWCGRIDILKPSIPIDRVVISTFHLYLMPTRMHQINRKQTNRSVTLNIGIRMPSDCKTKPIFNG